MLIVGINGIRCQRNEIWETLVPAFSKRYCGATFAVEEDSGMDWHEIGRQRRFIELLQERYDRANDELVLIGHSLGGVFASALAHRLRRAQLRGVVTICSPNDRLWIYPAIHGALGTIPAPVVSVAGFCDRIVWRGANHPDSVEHLILDCDHYWRLVGNVRHAETIAEMAVRHIK